MENIQRIVSPSEHIRALISGVRNAPFDIVTPDRIYTLVPLLAPSEGESSDRQHVCIGSPYDSAAKKAAAMSPSHQRSGVSRSGRDAKQTGDFTTATVDSAQKRMQKPTITAYDC